MNRTDAESNTIIGHMLQAAREQAGVTQKAMQDSTKLTKNHISAVERGESKASVQMLLGYCDKLGVTPNDILGYNSDANILPELASLIASLTEDQQQKLLAMCQVLF